jgi:hypothetical protein
VRVQSAKCKVEPATFKVKTHRTTVEAATSLRHLTNF